MMFPSSSNFVISTSSELGNIIQTLKDYSCIVILLFWENFFLFLIEIAGKE